MSTPNELVKKYITDEEFSKTFPELERQFLYYAGLKEKENAPGGCSNCTLNKLRATEKKIATTIVNDAKYYKRFEAYLNKKGALVPARPGIPDKPKVDDSYIQMKKVVARNFEKYPISKIQFIGSLRSEEVRKFLLEDRDTKETAEALFEEFKTDTPVSSTIKTQIDSFYDLIWSELEIVTRFHKEYTKHMVAPTATKATKIKQKLSILEADSKEELEDTVNDFMGNHTILSVTVTKSDTAYIATILHR